MDPLQAFFWILSLVLFIVAAFYTPPRVSLLALGAAAYVAGALVPVLTV
jgi:hypothetical protein